MKILVIALFLLVAGCLADPPTEQKVIRHWKTRENIDLVFTREHTFTMKSPSLPRGAGGTWVLHRDAKIDMIVTAEVNAAMQQKPVSKQTIQGQTLTVSGHDTIQVVAPGGLTDTWTRTNVP